MKNMTVYYPSCSTEWSEDLTVTLDFGYYTRQRADEQTVAQLADFLHQFFEHTVLLFVIRLLSDEKKDLFGEYPHPPVKEVEVLVPFPEPSDPPVVYELHYRIPVEKSAQLLRFVWSGGYHYTVWICPDQPEITFDFPVGENPETTDLRSATERILEQTGWLLVRSASGLMAHILLPENAKEALIEKIKERITLVLLD